MTGESETCTCCTCGYLWKRGQHGGHSCAEQLKAELTITERLLAIANTVLQEIPECPVHGPTCVPHAIEWVRKMKALTQLGHGPYPPYPTITICETMYGRVRAVWGLDADEYTLYTKAIHTREI